MSMYLEFEPYGHYMFFAIKKNSPAEKRPEEPYWEAYTDDGNAYRIVKLQANTLRELKEEIRAYHRRSDGKYMPASLEKVLKKKEV